MISVILSLVLISAPFQHIDSPQGKDKAETASTYAVEAAKMAGTARHCKFDKDLIDEYISLVQVRITNLSKDKEESILAKMDFTNTLILAAVQPPEIGCSNYNQTFLTALHDLN